MSVYYDQNSNSCKDSGAKLFGNIHKAQFRDNPVIGCHTADERTETIKKGQWIEAV